MLPNLTRWYQIWPDVTKFDQMIPNLTRWYQIWPDDTKFDQMLLNLTRCYQIWPDVTFGCWRAIMKSYVIIPRNITRYRSLQLDLICLLIWLFKHCILWTFHLVSSEIETDGANSDDFSIVLFFVSRRVNGNGCLNFSMPAIYIQANKIRSMIGSAWWVDDLRTWHHRVCVWACYQQGLESW